MHHLSALQVARLRLIDQGVIVVLEYRGNQGNAIGTISLNRDTCSALK